jgi:phospholipid/cholesterol/gamma-HCH transport system substrate-binding protein
MTPRRNDVVVGGVIVLAVLLVFFGTMWLRGAALGRDQIVVHARFREVGQVMEGNSVKLRGVPIGRVVDIRLEPGGRGVLVGLRIDRDAELPADAVVLLSPESLFGDWQAEIHPRSRFPDYTYAESTDPELLPGYSLPDLSQLTAVADRIAANMAVLSDRVELAFTEETALNVRSVIENIQTVSEQLTGLVDRQMQVIDDVAANLETTTTTFGEAAEAARRVFTEVDRALAGGDLVDIVDNVHRAATQLDTLTGALLRVSADLASAATTADSTFRSLNAIAGGLQRGEGTMGRLFQDTTLYLDLVRTNEQLRTLIADIQANPRRYIRLF